MKIIKRGSPKVDPGFFGICHNCDSEVDAVGAELDHNNSAACPVCKRPMFFCSRALTMHELNLSVRSLKCLHRVDAKYVWQLLYKTPGDLLSCKNVGVTSLNEIRNELSKLGLKLRER